MTNKIYDHMICSGIPVEAFVGFKSIEQGIRQKLVIDFDAEVERIENINADSSADIKIDYSVVYQNIKKIFADTHFNLIETIAETISDMILKTFAVRSVTVSVTKRPLDMQDVEAVTYKCCRMSHENHQ